jgi:hypothetical protein
MKQDQQPDAWFTTMIDLYALPDDFPGFENCATRGNATDRVECLEERLAQDIAHLRFIPYIQLHEFEALLFSDVSQICGRVSRQCLSHSTTHPNSGTGFEP